MRAALISRKACRGFYHVTRRADGRLFDVVHYHDEWHVLPRDGSGVLAMALTKRDALDKIERKAHV